MSHVATVEVWRCGLWGDPCPPCRGTEHGCGDPECAEARRMLEARDDIPPRSVIVLTHAEFLRDYGRCPTGPHGCRVAEQLTLETPC